MAAVRSILAALGQLLGNLWSFWMRDIAQRQSTKGKLASVGIGLVVICCAFSIVTSTVRGTGQALGIIPTSTPTPLPPTATMPPTATPPPRDAVVRETLLYQEPSAFATQIGYLCPGDKVTFLEQHQAAIIHYFKVQVISTGAACNDRRVGAEEVGWAADNALTPPSMGVAAVPTSTPAPTETPAPTRTPAPTETPLPPTPTPAPIAGHIGVSRESLQSTYELLGFRFQTAHDVDGQPRVMGIMGDKSASIELIGPPENLTTATVLTSLTNNDEAQNRMNALYMVGLLDKTLPDWSDGPTWLSKQAKTPNANDGTHEITVHGRKVTAIFLELSDGYVVTLSVKGIK